MHARRNQVVAVLAAAAASVLGAACGNLTEGGARQTLPPLPPPGQGVSITQATLPTTQAAPATTLGPGETVATDDADPLSVASRFLNAAATNDSSTGGALEVGVTQPSTFEWAAATYDATVDVAGVEAWGGPRCSEPAGGMVTCTWLLNDPTASLVLVQVDGTWRVSHPFQPPADGEPATVGQQCIAGNVPVNMRGGPSTAWPRFASLSPGTCVTALDATATDSEGVWRYIEVDGRRGWVVDRVLS